VRRTANVVLVLACFFILHNPGFAQQRKEEEVKRVAHRNEALGTKSTNGGQYPWISWDLAFKSVVKTFSPDDTSVNSYSILLFGSRLWQDDIFQEKTSDIFLPRVANISKAAFDVWRQALVDATGTDLPKAEAFAWNMWHVATINAENMEKLTGVTPSVRPQHDGEGSTAMFILYQIVQQDRLFNKKGTFNDEESKILLARLKTVPREAVVEWSDAIDPDSMGSLHEAAASIIEQDSLFANGTFQRDAFNQRLQELKAKKHK